MSSSPIVFLFNKKKKKTDFVLKTYQFNSLLRKKKHLIY